MAKPIVNAIGLVLIFWAILFYGMLPYATCYYGYIPQYGRDADNIPYKKGFYEPIITLVTIFFVFLAPVWVFLTIDLAVAKTKLNSNEKCLIIGSVIALSTFLMGAIFLKNYMLWVND
jgi:hypothetical protein